MLTIHRDSWPTVWTATCLHPTKLSISFSPRPFHGAKDVIKHFTIAEYDRQKNREAAYASFDNAQCQKCHRNLLAMPDKRGAMLAHRTVLYARPGYEKKCVDCHYDLVHNNQVTIMYKQYRKLPYQAKGLRNL
jgi:hypothetical protein